MTHLGKGDFPSFQRHGVARCFNCNSWLVAPRLEGFAHGQYSAACAGGCGMRTWYDIEPNEEQAQ